jgi:predicted Zn-dependent protease
MALLIGQQRWPDLEVLAGDLEGRPEGSLFAAGVRIRVQLGQRQFAAAQAAVQQLIDRYPSTVEPRTLLSHALLQEGLDWPAAERALQAVLALAPEHGEAQHNLAVLRQLQSQRLCRNCE